MGNDPSIWLKLITLILQAFIAILEIIKNWPKGPRT